ncbi:MAG: tetratricopeptide repeat protein [Tildeniella torsiva UHER 1998/13D]|jgi:tetratricopeptide (TPR) repeat protein|nr:tetratricopeptide repeat protein [Tildeniella torsiva UHER 1998/13D]
MDSPQPRPLPPLDQLLDAYESAITLLEGIAADEATNEVSHQLVMDALLARDAVEKVRQDSEKSASVPLPTGVYARLIKLDQRLKSKTNLISGHGDLENSRQSINPNAQAWWWFLTPAPKATKQHEQDRFDWAWNGLTVVFLVMTTSFATSTAKAFSIQGFDVVGLFSSFIQGAGLAFVAGGAFTDKGQRAVQSALRSVNIPCHHHSEATCLLSASLLTMSFLGYSNLYRLGNLYYSWGQGERDRGDNISAFQTFQKVLDFAPNKKEAYSALGQVAEKMGRLEDASTYYEQGLALSDPASALGMARLVLINTLKESGWAAPMDNQKVREVEFYLELASQFNLALTLAVTR